MKTGRPPNWNPVSALTPRAWTEVVGLSSKSRLQFPVAIRSRVAWLSHAGDGLLAVLEPNGSAEIQCWKPHGEAELEAVRILLQSTNEFQRGAVAIAAMDRLLKLTFDPDGRTVLPFSLTCHLHAAGPDAAVRIVTVDGRLWMWSEREWQSRRGERAALLKGPHSSE
jgi:DNA-binding transcriptional regulator/RsmH inhibitor MraZ